MTTTLTSFVAGVWTAADPVRIVGMRLTATMTVVELPDGLLLFSPVELTPERRAAVDALGPVRHLYAPNTFHHRWLGAWSEAYPAAAVHAPRGVRAKRRDLRIDREHDRDETPPDLRAVFDEVHVDGFALEETVLVHRPSGTLLAADLVHNIGRPEGLWTRTYSGLMGFYDRVAISRAIRWLGFADRAAARRSIDRIAACSFDRLVVGHGSPLGEGARAAVVGAYSWLQPGARQFAPPMPAPKHGFCG